MRGNVREILPRLQEGMRCWYAIVATEPVSHSQRCYVTIPDFDPKLRWGPCRWQSRDDISTPARGDHALVVFDNRREPWVVAWWPFTT